MQKVHITDVILRDAHQSLIAMRTLFLASAMGGVCAAGRAQSVVRGEYWIDEDLTQ